MLGESRFDSSTEALRELHWLEIRKRVQFKAPCLVHKSVNQLAPEYLDVQCFNLLPRNLA